MPGRVVRRLTQAFAATAAALALFAAAAEAGGPTFRAADGDSIQPRFKPAVHTYAARCDGPALDLRIDGARGWTTTAPGRHARRGDLSIHARLDPGQPLMVTFTRKDGKARRYHLRCLPDDFPAYRFHRLESGGPRLFMIQLQNYYATIIDRNGVPVWWRQADGYPDDAKVLPDGTISWDSVTAGAAQTGRFDVLTLTGKAIRVVGNSDNVDVHDLQLLPNGDYMIGEQQYRAGLDLTAYGGSAYGAVADIEIQRLTPDGDVRWRWNSADHIDLAETGRWWSVAKDQFIADIVHWNAVEPAGRFMYLSFRHLDAIYKVDRRTGDIVWKLGGTPTPESLEIRGDPHNDYPLGGQHDVRLQPDGTVTVFNNRTDLPDAVPRADRFRIDEQAGTATLLDSITDPKITDAGCCGSARRLPSKEWLVAWGRSDLIGAYDRSGRPIFRLRTPDNFTYRANPVPPGTVNVADLRDAMDRMYR